MLVKNMSMIPKSKRLLLGETAGRPKGQPVWLGLQDRLQHIYVLGKSGTGKSTLFKSLIQQNTSSGLGLCLLDPHGDLASEITNNLGREITYWDVANPNAGVVFNPLKKVPEQYRTRAASGLLEALKHLWGNSWGDRLENILRYTILALIETERSTLKDVTRMLVDDGFRATVLAYVTNPQVIDFWQGEFEGYPKPLKAQAIAPIQAKIGALLADPLMQKIFCGEGRPISFRKAMDKGQVLIINLAQGRLGSDTSHLLGAMLVSTIGLAAHSRSELPESKRKPFFLYVDEFQNFSTQSFSEMLSSTRKYGVGLVLAHQFLGQLDSELRESIFGNCGTIISFRVGASDAAYLAREFHPIFSQQDLLRMPNYQVRMRMMIQGMPSQPFALNTPVPSHATRYIYLTPPSRSSE